LHQFFNITYQERWRVMARWNLDNLLRFISEKGANSISFNNGTDKSDSKLT